MAEREQKPRTSKRGLHRGKLRLRAAFGWLRRKFLRRKRKLVKTSKKRNRK